jgi:transposase InsO family protein
VRSDNGSEFKNTNVEEFCDEKGIKHEFSTTYTPEQNGVVERKNRTLIEMARSILDKYKVSDFFGPKQSTPLAMLQIGYISMNFLLEGSQILLIFGSLVANVIF